VALLRDEAASEGERVPMESGFPTRKSGCTKRSSESRRERERGSYLNQADPSSGTSPFVGGTQGRRDDTRIRRADTPRGLAGPPLRGRYGWRRGQSAAEGQETDKNVCLTRQRVGQPPTHRGQCFHGTLGVNLRVPSRPRLLVSGDPSSPDEDARHVFGSEPRR